MMKKVKIIHGFIPVCANLKRHRYDENNKLCTASYTSKYEQLNPITVFSSFTIFADVTIISVLSGGLLITLGFFLVRCYKSYIRRHYQALSQHENGGGESYILHENPIYCATLEDIDDQSY